MLSGSVITTTPTVSSPGYITRCQQKEEINAENHFYSVRWIQEGLVGYWKLNDGAGQIIKEIILLPGSNMLVKSTSTLRVVSRSVTAGMNWVEMGHTSPNFERIK